MKFRINKIRALLEEHDAEAALLTFLPNIRWACGFTGSNGILVVRPDAAHFVTDGRYEVQARKEVRGADVHVPGYDLIGRVEEEGLFGAVHFGAVHRVLFQPDHATVAQLEEWKETFPEIVWVPGKEFLDESVAVKDQEEISKIHAAQRITDDTFEHLISTIQPGMTEKEVASEIVYQHLQSGAERVAFEPIVASGPNAALPHARPTDRVLQEGELVLIDMGGVLDGYASDMTRTIALGEPGAEARRVYEVVLEAQAQALEAARAGLESKALDGAAREVIEEAGYGDEFPHSLGHGIGLQTHEWPSVSYRREYVLPEGAVVTIEPGIYIEGAFGVRIEDIVVLREKGSENLTGAPKELIVL